MAKSVALNPRDNDFDTAAAAAPGAIIIFNPSSARCAAGDDWLGRYFVGRQLRLEIGPPFVETGDHDEQGRGDKHQDGKEAEVLKVGQLSRSVGVQVPSIEFSDEQFACADE